MTNIALGGVYGPAVVSLGQIEATQAREGNFPSPQNLTATSVYALHSAQPRACEPVSFTAAGDAFWNGQNFGAGFAPGVLANNFSVKGVDGTRVFVDGLDGANSYTPTMYVDGIVEFRRVVNGEMVLAASGTVSAGKFEQVARTGTNVTRAISGTTYHYRFDSWNAANRTYWFAVSAVTSAGVIGKRSSWAAHVPTSTSSSTSVSNSFVTTPNQTENAAAINAPTGVTATLVANGLVDINWKAVSGAIGYIVWIAYSAPSTWPTTGQGELTLSNLTGTPAAGDMMIWRREIVRMSEWYICTRVMNDGSTTRNLIPGFVQSGRLNMSSDAATYELRDWPEGQKPSADLGPWYLRRTLKPSASIADGVYWSSATGNNAYHNKKPGDVLVVDVWMRASRPTTISFTSGQPGEPTQSIQVGTSWAPYRLTSDYVREASGTVAYMWKIIATAGSTGLLLDFAQLRAYLQGADYGTARSYIAQSFLPGQKFRDHQLVKTKPRTYSASMVTGPAGEGYKGWTCGMHMDMCRQHDLIPWVQLEWIWPKADWLLWANWLATTYPDAGKVMLELGNENWNPLSGFWLMPGMTDQATGESWGAGQVYGMMTRMVWQWLQESPHWPWLSQRLELVIGGWLGASFGESAYEKCPEAKYVTVANYNGGWDVEATLAEETGQYFRSMTAFKGGESKLIKREDALAQTAATLGKTLGRDVFHDIYEAGPGYQLDGLNGAALSAEQSIVQECVKKSRAAAMAQLDAVCICWTRGWLPNFFTMGVGTAWKSHREDGVEYLPHAVGRVISERLGPFRAHDIYPIKTSSRDAVEDIGIRAFQSISEPGRWLYVVLNRRIDQTVLDPRDPLHDAAQSGVLPVTILTPHASATQCRVFKAGLGNMRAHNRYPEGARRQVDNSYAPDPLCVSFDLDWHVQDVPADVGRLVIDDRFGADPGGLRGGNFLMIELNGVI